MRHAGWFWVVTALVFLAGCGEKMMEPLTGPSESLEQRNTEGGMAKLVLAIPQDIQPPVRSVEYAITGSGISDPIEGTMSIVNDEARATVTSIPAGRSRTFTINVYGDKSIMTFSGFSKADVASRETVQVVVDLARLTGKIPMRAYPAKNATHAEITVSASDLPQPIVQTLQISSHAALFYDSAEKIPTGADRHVTFKAYDKSPDKITDIGTATVDVYHDRSEPITIELSSTAGTAEIVGRFPG